MFKVCVVGGGFTGITTAISIKKNNPNVHVTLIDSDKEPRNLGFGESGPPTFLDSICQILCIKESERLPWLTKFITETHGTIKYNFKWQDFLGKSDDGYLSGIRDIPDYRAILDGSHSGIRMNPKVTHSDNNSYTLFDLWYELYLAGERKAEDFQSDINDLYWYTQRHSVFVWDKEFVSGNVSLNMNSFEVCDWFKKEYGSIIDEIIIGTVKDFKQTDSGMISGLVLDSDRVVDSNFYIDCTGFKRIFGKKFNLPWAKPKGEILHDSVVVTANGYSKDIEREMQPYTIGYGMDYGWTFSIPLIDRKSYGYSFDSSFITADQALEELATLSDPKTRVVDPVTLKWDPGYYSTSTDANYACVGLSSAFVDPFDANTLALQFRQIICLNDFFKDVKNLQHFRKRFNNITVETSEAVAERVELHFGLAPRETSEYWVRNHEIAKRKNLESKIFDVMNRYEHTPRATTTGDFVPYFQHVYLTELIYYGIDMSRRCRQSDPNLLKFAKDYFITSSRMNKVRADMSPTLKQWYLDNGIDITQYIKF